MVIQPIQLRQPPPYFAELAYYLWGQVNYDSEGNCKKPTDRTWTEIYLENRESREVVELRQQDDGWLIDCDERTGARLAMFLVERCDAVAISRLGEATPDWNHDAAMARARLVRSEFEQEILAPFDSHFFWGSWKWIGWYATDFTWVGRWIMHSLVRKDQRAIPLCIDWIKTTRFPEQAAALSYAVEQLSGEPARGPEEWVRWYEGGWFRKGAKRRYPEPDFNRWLLELKQEAGEEGK